MLRPSLGIEETVCTWCSVWLVTGHRALHRGQKPAYISSHVYAHRGGLTLRDPLMCRPFYTCMPEYCADDCMPSTTKCIRRLMPFVTRSRLMPGVNSELAQRNVHGQARCVWGGRRPTGVDKNLIHATQQHCLPSSVFILKPLNSTGQTYGGPSA